MNTSQLKCVINCDSVMKKMIKGVFARDEIPSEISSFPSGFIVNTDDGHHVGRHWLAFYFESKIKTEFFDSYGHSPDYFSFEGNTYNDKRLQSSKSIVCGQYCLYYLLNRCRGVPMKSITKPFGNDLEENDNFVNEYITNSFPHCFHSMHTHQTCCAEL